MYIYFRSYSPLSPSSQPHSPGDSNSRSDSPDIPRIDLMNEVQDLLKLRLENPPVDRSVIIKIIIFYCQMYLNVYLVDFSSYSHPYRDDIVQKIVHISYKNSILFLNSSKFKSWMRMRLRYFLTYFEDHVFICFFSGIVCHNNFSLQQLMFINLLSNSYNIIFSTFVLLSFLFLMILRLIRVRRSLIFLFVYQNKISSLLNWNSLTEESAYTFNIIG